MHIDPGLTLASWNVYLDRAPDEVQNERTFMRRAAQLYQQHCEPGGLREVWRFLRQRVSELPSLSEVEKRYSSGHYGGTQAVPISQIRGSEDRGGDYDQEFRPRRTASRMRWISIAMARMQQVPLPPVDLIQVGDSYYVRDGHHRISVARAMGEQFIDASVIVWEPVRA